MCTRAADYACDGGRRVRLGTRAQLRSNCNSGYYDIQDRNSISTFLLCTGGRYAQTCEEVQCVCIRQAHNMGDHLSIDAVVDDALLVRLVRGANAADGARYILRRHGLQGGSRLS